MTEPQHAILFDPKQMRPACVLLQAASNADTTLFRRLFGAHSKLWLTFPNDDMRMMTGTREEWEQVAARVIGGAA